jgi:ferritin
VKLPDDLAQAFNKQVTMELSSSIAYMQMAAEFEDRNLSGMATWMRLQAEEEKDHAYRFFDFVLHRGNKVKIGQIEAPSSEFAEVAEFFEAALAQERAVTRSIHDIYRMATEQGDLGSLPFLQTFIEEQNEEEATVETILERVKLAGGESSAILLLDSQLGGRA